MAEGAATPSSVVPVLVAALLCDTAAVDPTTGKKSLIGIFDRIWGQFPTTRPMCLYWKITDAVGHYSVKVRIARGDTQIGEAMGEVEVPDRLLAYDYLLQLPPVPLLDSGRYQFQVFMNNAYLGSAVLDAEQSAAGLEA